MDRMAYRHVVASNFDPAVYREWLARRYGQMFEFGGMPDLYFAGIRHAKRLARRIGENVDFVIATAIADRRIIDAQEE